MSKASLFVGAECVGEVCSNLDHTTNQDVLRDLQEIPNSYAEYPGWDFWSTVVYDRERKKFIAEVMCHHVVQDYPEADTFEELKAEICERWGNG